MTSVRHRQLGELTTPFRQNQHGQYEEDSHKRGIYMLPMLKRTIWHGISSIWLELRDFVNITLNSVIWHHNDGIRYIHLFAMNNQGNQPPRQGVRQDRFQPIQMPSIPPPSINVQPTYNQGSGFGANIQFGWKFWMICIAIYCSPIINCCHCIKQLSLATHPSPNSRWVGRTKHVR